MITRPKSANDEVYPRVCGGTGPEGGPVAREGGLSPRVRGNPDAAARHIQRRWSIPACAGEPLHIGPAIPFLRVYPRVCGGTTGPEIRATGP